MALIEQKSKQDIPKQPINSQGTTTGECKALVCVCTPPLAQSQLGNVSAAVTLMVGWMDNMVENTKAARTIQV